MKTFTFSVHTEVQKSKTKMISLKVIADGEAEAGVHFKIVETGGLSMRSIPCSSGGVRSRY